jgi:transaldolase
MKIFLDTINLNCVRSGVKTGIISGITTNPSILSKAKNVRETLLQLLDLQDGPVAVQVTSNEPQDMIEEGRSIHQFSSRMIVKVPVNLHGLITMRQLCQEGIPVLGTGIFHPAQALLAANHGATYISPYFSHMGEMGNAFETLKSMADILKLHNHSTQILAASLRQLDHLAYCALIGIEAVTIKDDLYEKLISEHPLLENFSKKFSNEWKEAHGNASIKDFLTEAVKQ